MPDLLALAARIIDENDTAFFERGTPEFNAALAARIIDEDDKTARTNFTNGELAECGPGIALIQGFGHVIAIDTGDGLVVFDTSGASMAPRILESLRGWSGKPIDTIVYTHGHIDHVGGAVAFLADAAERSHPRPRIVAHENVAARFARYDATNGYNAVINARQFGATRQADFVQPRFMTGFVHPDVTYAERLNLRCGDLQVELHHARGETDDHTWAWIPWLKAVCSGDLVTWVFPNAGNPQKVQRYPAEWAAALRAIAAKEPELLLPAHGLPIAGQERIAMVLDTIASALEYLVRETVALMNEGARLDAIIGAVKLPPELSERPYLRAVYDEPEFVIRNTWRLYGGWYDGNPARLKPPEDAVLAREVASLAGGAATLAARAKGLAETGDLKAACQLAEWAAQAAPDDAAIHAVRADVYEARRDAELSLMARGIFSSAAAESRGKAGG